MNLAFTDISSTFSNMVQQDIPREIMSDSNNSNWQTSQFAEKLNKIFKKIENYEKPLSPMAEPDTQKNHSAEFMDFLSEKLNNTRGQDFVSALQNIFLLFSNNDLKNSLIDTEGLAALKTMLLEAGFNQSEINDLLDGLLEDQENDSISISDLLDKLFDLSMENELPQEDDPGNYLEISTIPFLESLMNSLKIPDEKIQEILTLAERGDKGLDLDFIISRLQGLQKESFYNGNQYKIEETDENFRLLLKQLGFENRYSRESSLTLNDLVDSLEKLRTEKSQQNTTVLQTNFEDKNNIVNGKFLDTLEALLKGLTLKNPESKMQVFEFSEGQIKNQFKNQLFAQLDDKIETNDLFSLNHKKSKYNLDTAIKHGLKEMESMLDGKKNNTLGTKGQSLDSREFSREQKFEGTKVLDKNQISTLNIRTSDTQSDVNILKTKASFKNLPNFVTRQVSKNLVQAINQGENSIRVQLKPPELGRLLLTIDNTGSNIKINVITENSAAREILTSNVNELRTILSNSGVSLERFEVDMSSDFRQSMADAKNQARNYNKRNKNREDFLSDSVNKANPDESNGLVNALDKNGSVNLVA